MEEGKSDYISKYGKNWQKDFEESTQVDFLAFFTIMRSVTRIPFYKDKQEEFSCDRQTRIYPVQKPSLSIFEEEEDINVKNVLLSLQNPETNKKYNPKSPSLHF